MVSGELVQQQCAGGKSVHRRLSHGETGDFGQIQCKNPYIMQLSNGLWNIHAETLKFEDRIYNIFNSYTGNHNQLTTIIIKGKILIFWKY